MLLKEIQRTGDIFFPKRWMDATLSGYQTPEAAARRRGSSSTQRACRGDYPERLRGAIVLSSVATTSSAAEVLRHRVKTIL